MPSFPKIKKHNIPKQDFFPRIVGPVPLTDILPSGECFMVDQDDVTIQEEAFTFLVTIAGVTGLDEVVVNGQHLATRTSDLEFSISHGGNDYDASAATATIQIVPDGPGVDGIPVDRGNYRDTLEEYSGS